MIFYGKNLGLLVEWGSSKKHLHPQSVKILSDYQLVAGKAEFEEMNIINKEAIFQGKLGYGKLYWNKK